MAAACYSLGRGWQTTGHMGGDRRKVVHQLQVAQPSVGGLAAATLPEVDTPAPEHRGTVQTLLPKHY